MMPKECTALSSVESQPRPKVEGSPLDEKSSMA
jgi:hypothetical protein